jgi:hypothetical protein
MKLGIFEAQQRGKLADSDSRLQLNRCINRGFIGVWGKPSTKSSTILALVHYPAQARRGHAHCTDARQIQTS